MKGQNTSRKLLSTSSQSCQGVGGLGLWRGAAFRAPSAREGAPRHRSGLPPAQGAARRREPGPSPQGQPGPAPTSRGCGAFPAQSHRSALELRGAAAPRPPGPRDGGQVGAEAARPGGAGPEGPARGRRPEGGRVPQETGKTPGSERPLDGWRRPRQGSELPAPPRPALPVLLWGPRGPQRPASRVRQAERGPLLCTGTSPFVQLPLCRSGGPAALVLRHVEGILTAFTTASCKAARGL